MFKKDEFLVGASVSSHQVDGGRHDQWTSWEETNAKKLAGSAQKRLSHLPSWHQIKSQATSPANYRSENGVEHRKYYKEDLKIAAELGLNAFRFSVDWSELEPFEGEWNEEALAFYDVYFAELKKLKLEPVVTLWHWTHPQWFEDMGAFEKKSNLHYFYRYARKVIERYGKNIRFLCVLNEPNVFTSESYLTGEWPPNRHSLWLANKVYRNLSQAHRTVRAAAKKIYPEMSVGTSLLLNNVQPKRPNHLLDRLVAHWERRWWNWSFLEKIRWQSDFIGVNYYFTNYTKGFRHDNPSEPLNDLGWYMEPAGLEEVLYRANLHFKKPIIVTETGVADAHDQWRQWWIDETFAAIKRAQARGVDVRGYIHWSLLDNFEWSYGWWPKFGLVAVDHQDLAKKRFIRGSAKTLTKHAKSISN